jgi:NTP pyrophosphatase (non-canonical NTP hydrolase)
MANSIVNRIFEEIQQERLRQEALRQQGRFAHTCADAELLQSERLAILIEEVGEVAKAILNVNGLANDAAETDLRKELIQAAAVCVAWLEGLNKPAPY